MWLDTNEIRQKFNISSNRFETQIAAASDSAALIIQRSVDSTTYAEAIDDTAPTDTDELARYSSVVQAHSFLTMWFLVGNVGNKLGESGFIKSTQTGSSPVQTQQVSDQYLTPKELAEMRAGFLENAQLWIGPYGSIDMQVDIVAAETSLAISSLKWF